jgi:hypothetical protein
MENIAVVAWWWYSILAVCTCLKYIHEIITSWHVYICHISSNDTSERLDSLWLCITERANQCGCLSQETRCFGVGEGGRRGVDISDFKICVFSYVVWRERSERREFIERESSLLLRRPCVRVLPILDWATIRKVVALWIRWGPTQFVRTLGEKED